MLRVEFHCHTKYSKDSLTEPERLLEICRQKGIDRIAITDHNSIAGALRAQQLDPERVIVGEEIMTTKGELLAFFVQEEIQSGLYPEEVLNLLQDQGAFISVSHPFDRLRNGHWKEKDLIKIIPHIDAIETFNARCMWPGFNREAQEFALKYGLAGTVGSDAHAGFEVGKATHILPKFTDTQSLKQALEHAEPQTSLSAPWVHFSSRYAVWRKKINEEKN